jgi:type I restriction enzyme S subunit
MRGEWNEVTVEQIKADTPSALATGPFGSAISSQFFLESGIPVIRGSNLSQDVGRRLIEDGFVFVSHEKAQEFQRSIARSGDLIFTCWGTIDQVGLVDERSNYPEYIVSNKQMKFTPDKARANSLFLYYLFSSPALRDRILSQGIGSSVPGFNLGQLRSMKLSLPPLDEQKAIANVLGTIDDKIELNRKMSETLEGIGRALFKSWFVDFDPVRAKSGSRGTTLPAHIAGLFPDSFRSALSDEIPKEWTYAQVGDIAHVVDCLHSKKPDRTRQGRPLLQLWNIREDSLLDMSDTYFIAEEDYQKWISRMEARPGDCVITNVGRVGAVAQIPAGFKAALGRNMTGIRCRDQYPFPTFLVQALTSDPMKEEIEHLKDSGTILDALNVRNIPKLRLVLPSVPVLAAFERLGRPIQARMEQLQQESSELRTMRDALLPRLISGEVRVSGGQV